MNGLRRAQFFHATTEALGSGAARNAQRNGFTPARNMTSRDHLYSGKFIFFKNAL